MEKSKIMTNIKRYKWWFLILMMIVIALGIGGVIMIEMVTQ